MRRPGWLRLLPITIFVMSSLLAVKSAQLVRAAVHDARSRRERRLPLPKRRRRRSIRRHRRPPRHAPAAQPSR